MTLRLHDLDLRGFASDNYAGIHPEILDAIAAANDGHQIAYGEDVYTARLNEVVAEHFGAQAQAFPVFNGTGANVVGLQSMLPRWGAVVCTTTAHIHTDEAGAPERVGGIKLLPVETPDGKLTPELIDKEAWGWGDEHRAQPRRLDHPDHRARHRLHGGRGPRDRRPRPPARHDPAHGRRPDLERGRLPRLPLRDFTTDAGVDVLSFGGTKNGMLYGEAIVVLNPDASEGLHYLRKLNMQLSSKMRFVSAQLIALLTDDLYLRSAGHANAMAQRLRGALEAGIADGSIRASGSARTPRRTGSSRPCPPGWPTASASTSGSTTGTPAGTRCGGCARSTPRSRTSTRSWRR